MAALSVVLMPQFGRLKALNTSAIASSETRVPSGIRCCTRMSVLFCAGWMNALRGTQWAVIGRLRPDGTLATRNDFIQPAQNKTDIRVQQRIPLGGRFTIDLLADALNVFNREMFVNVTEESAANYQRPASGHFRTVQLGFRLSY